MASQKVKRNWRKPSSVIANAKCEGLPDDSQFAVGYSKSCFYTGFGVSDLECTAQLRLLVSDTPGGKWVNSYDSPWYHNGKIVTPGIDYNRDIKPIDICQSAAYARAAEGDVLVFVKCRNDPVNNPSSVLWTTELPTLLENPKVTSIKAYDNCVPHTAPCVTGAGSDTWCNEVVYK
jgi:hypothetical protein